MKVKQDISPETVICRASGFITSEIDGETVMMSVEQGRYFGLDAVGTRIWDLIESPKTVSDITVQLLAEFEVDPEICQKDVVKFLTMLNEKQMITLS